MNEHPSRLREKIERENKEYSNQQNNIKKLKELGVV
jgi:hypothetical protein